MQETEHKKYLSHQEAVTITKKGNNEGRNKKILVKLD